MGAGGSIDTSKSKSSVFAIFNHIYDGFPKVVSSLHGFLPKIIERCLTDRLWLSLDRLVGRTERLIPLMKKCVPF
jgi:hypothetical protein